MPIYLESKLQRQLEALAQKNGKEMTELVNKLLAREVDLINEFSAND